MQPLKKADRSTPEALQICVYLYLTTNIVRPNFVPDIKNDPIVHTKCPMWGKMGNFT